MTAIIAAHPAPVHSWPMAWVLAVGTLAVVGGLLWLSRRGRRLRPSVAAVQSRPPAQVHEITEVAERPAFDQSYVVVTSDEPEGGEYE